MSKKQEAQEKGRLFSIHEGYHWPEAGSQNFNLVLTPRMGSRNIGITSAEHLPGMEFAPHIHPLSEELVFVHSGEGEFYLYDRWYPVKEGDVLYAPPGVMHGTRKPEGGEGVFITIGVATPPQLDLYQRIGYDVLAEDEDL